MESSSPPPPSSSSSCSPLPLYSPASNTNPHSHHPPPWVASSRSPPRLQETFASSSSPPPPLSQHAFPVKQQGQHKLQVQEDEKDSFHGAAYNATTDRFSDEKPHQTLHSQVNSTTPSSSSSSSTCSYPPPPPPPPPPSERVPRSSSPNLLQGVTRTADPLPVVCTPETTDGDGGGGGGEGRQSGDTDGERASKQQEPGRILRGGGEEEQAEESATHRREHFRPSSSASSLPSSFTSADQPGCCQSSLQASRKRARPTEGDPSSELRGMGGFPTGGEKEEEEERVIESYNPNLSGGAGEGEAGEVRLSHSGVGTAGGRVSLESGAVPNSNLLLPPPPPPPPPPPVILPFFESDLNPPSTQNPAQPHRPQSGTESNSTTIANSRGVSSEVGSRHSREKSPSYLQEHGQNQGHASLHNTASQPYTPAGGGGGGGGCSGFHGKKNMAGLGASKRGNNHFVMTGGGRSFFPSQNPFNQNPDEEGGVGGGPWMSSSSSGPPSSSYTPGGVVGVHTPEMSTNGNGMMKFSHPHHHSSSSSQNMSSTSSNLMMRPPPPPPPPPPLPPPPPSSSSCCPTFLKDSITDIDHYMKGAFHSPHPASQTTTSGQTKSHQGMLGGGGGGDRERDRGGEAADVLPASSANIGVRGRARLMNDYNQHFVDVGERPQNFIRDYEEEKRFQEYPKLEKLMKLKRLVLEKRNTPSLCVQGDLRNFDWGVFEGVKFDVILVDPPWKEYYDRCAAAIGATNEDLSYWSLEDLIKLPVDSIGETPSFCFLWCGVTHLEDARLLLSKWGYRRCEDICWLKTNKKAAQKRRLQGASHVNEVLSYMSSHLNHDETSALQRTTEHCLMGIKGLVRRSQDSHLIHANLDTDILVSEEEEEIGSTRKPAELYDIIERFCLGRRRIELFGRDCNRRAGWVTVGCELGLTTFDAKTYASYFEGDIAWPEATDYMGGRYVGTTVEIEQLRPKSPPKFGGGDRTTN